MTTTVVHDVHIPRVSCLQLSVAVNDNEMAGETGSTALLAPGLMLPLLSASRCEFKIRRCLLRRLRRRSCRKATSGVSSKLDTAGEVKQFSGSWSSIGTNQDACVVCMLTFVFAIRLPSSHSAVDDRIAAFLLLLPSNRSRSLIILNFYAQNLSLLLLLLITIFDSRLESVVNKNPKVGGLIRSFFRASSCYCRLRLHVLLLMLPSPIIFRLASLPAQTECLMSKGYGGGGLQRKSHKCVRRFALRHSLIDFMTSATRRSKKV